MSSDSKSSGETSGSLPEFAAGEPGVRVVIAEDEPATLRLLTRQLERAGYQVTPCADGREALETIQRNPVDLIIADWNMPGMDGIELCRNVRRLTLTGALPFVYYILLTAESEQAKIVEGLEAGADDYLAKPYHRRELLARLRAGERVVRLQADLLAQQEQLRTANEEMYELANQLKQLANTDTLTRLHNRRCLFERFADVLSQSHRFGRSLSCIMFDIDKFKRINDTYGHHAGDDVLRGIADACRTVCRQYDIVARFGGEEFCVICPDTDLEGAVTLAERLRMCIAETRFPAGADVIPVTTSLGVAQMSDEYSSEETLIAAADRMLYRAKDAGRNQTWASTPGGPMQIVACPTMT